MESVPGGRGVFPLWQIRWAHLPPAFQQGVKSAGGGLQARPSVSTPRASNPGCSWRCVSLLSGRVPGRGSRWEESVLCPFGFAVASLCQNGSPIPTRGQVLLGASRHGSTSYGFVIHSLVCSINTDGLRCTLQCPWLPLPPRWSWGRGQAGSWLSPLHLPWCLLVRALMLTG